MQLLGCTQLDENKFPRAERGLPVALRRRLLGDRNRMGDTLSHVLSLKLFSFDLRLALAELGHATWDVGINVDAST